jgi:hypothetical protein
MHSRELPLVGNAKKRSKKNKKTRWVGAFRWFLHMYVGVDFFFFQRPSAAEVLLFRKGVAAGTRYTNTPLAGACGAQRTTHAAPPPRIRGAYVTFGAPATT